MSLVLDIADAVTFEINAAENVFSQPFTAVRRVLPSFDLEALADLKVTVVPKGVQITGSTRSATQHDIAVDIGIQKKLTGTDADIDTQVHGLGTLVDQIAGYLTRRPLSGFPWATWVSIANDPVYAPEHLSEQRVFTSVLTTTYRAMK